MNDNGLFEHHLQLEDRIAIGSTGDIHIFTNVSHGDVDIRVNGVWN